MTNRLYRSTTDKMVGGVCGGLGKYLNIDATLVRLFFLILILTAGFGGLLYIILWIVLPREDQVMGQSVDFGDRARQVGQEFGDAVRSPNPKAAMYIGIALICAGGLFFIQALNIPWLSWLNKDLFWPIILILGGAALLVRAARKE
jgi:phage shock protein C